ncbi:uncharacterized protein DFL_005968 [Arthrobotrys flagrans]|uniref:Uncharacterized protein n=1 Tax=Arthrobotrys flagrans TaxID=97331 RepID=A0A436ZZU8_ARTFL|nr:hypothetical protein DFL_005968 [Arthrobotrys flagrans]
MFFSTYSLVLIVPVDPNDANPKGFNLDAMAQIEHYKRRYLVGLVVKLNERDNGKCIWNAYRSTICDGKGLLVTVKATASSTVRPITAGHQSNHGVANAPKFIVSAFGKPQGNLQPAFANRGGNQQVTSGTNQDFGSTNRSVGGPNQPAFGGANQGFGNGN